MTRRPFEEQLRGVPLFAGLSADQLRRLSRIGAHAHEPAGAQLTREGERGNEFLVILEGTVDIHHGDRVVATLEPGDFLGEIALIDGRARRSATAVATSAVVIAWFDRHAFSELLAESPEFANVIGAAVAARAADLEGRAPE
jgi:CRP-like cAMP-binding protein